VSQLAHEVALALTGSGSPSPGPEARQLVAHVLGIHVSVLMTVDDVTDEQRARVEELVARRAAGEPLQHLTGVAYFRYEELAVGPGVFIPRPETEEMVGWALGQLAARPAGSRRVVELCAGSGAITAAISSELGGCDLHAVELSADAWPYLERNLAGRSVDLRLGDMADAFRDLDGTVDLVIANPPYIPTGHRAFLPTDVVEHDPELALFSGADGLDAIRTVAAVARRLLCAGGLVVTEHDESHAAGVRAVLASAGLSEAATHPDLAGRDRFTSAVIGWDA